jgi:hypothetical protein
VLQYTCYRFGIAGATKVWAAVQWVLNESMLANPYNVDHCFNNWCCCSNRLCDICNKRLGQTVGRSCWFLKASWAGFKDYFSLIWLNVQDSFLTGIELIEKGWYRLKVCGIKMAANAGLSKINDEQNKRAEEIAKQKG